MNIGSLTSSDLRYNFFYPRWAYDSYRQLLAEMADQRDWELLDLWDAVSPESFTDSPVHLTLEGMQQLSEMIAPRLAASDS
ncbi:MAG: hypothetical protein L0Z53_16415 [Acidobacteriales bacterium]|nr:hypothetical protein [Terriglobales bacterium]